jgi:ABC-type transport system substrate-binding protein
MIDFKKFLLVAKKLLTFSGLEFFLKSLNKIEAFFFFIFLFLFLFSSSFLASNFYFKNTKAVPKEGGILIEGEIGWPIFLNPIYSLASDVDDSIVELLFASLIKLENGKVIPDLIKDYKISEEGKVFEFFLKEDAFWSDGKPITSDDVIFTVTTIQNPEVKSPLRGAWLGVSVEKISEKSFKFILKNPSSVFLENCRLKIIPKHIWESVPPANLSLSFLNLQPITSGPYEIEKIQRSKTGEIISLDLKRNEKYFGKKPYISKIKFKFFESEEGLIEAAKKKEVDAFSLKEFQTIPDFEILNFRMPRYFGVFLNFDKKIFSEKEVREALSYGTNKKEILEKAVNNQGKIVDSPILPEIFSLEKPKEKFNFDVERAKEILEKAGYQDIDGDGIREKIIKKEPSFQFKSNLSFGSRGKEVEELQKCLAKDPEIYPEGEISGYFGTKTKEAVIKFQEKYKEDILLPFDLKEGNGIVKEKTREKLNKICFERKEEKNVLKFSLATVDQPILIKSAEILKEQWKKLGFEVEIKTFKIEDLKREIIPKKDYDAILFGEVLGKIPDPFPFWHSSQKGENGLNLSNYQNKDVDNLLEETRKILDEEKRKENLEKLQEILIKETAAIFLYNPDYFYFVSKKVKGIKPAIISFPSERLEKISDWYIKERRVLK